LRGDGQYAQYPTSKVKDVLVLKNTSVFKMWRITARIRR
jgi:hypothetical protein